MHFSNRSISQIGPKEFVELIGTAEDQWLDCKHEPWVDNNEGLFEMLQDVTAMANAEGGYIILGASTKKEDGKDILRGFKSVSNPSKVAQSIRGHHYQWVDPRIEGFEVESVEVNWKNKVVDLVIVHIPPSSQRPHGFEWKDVTIFAKRYQDDVRKMPLSELGQLFSMRYFPETDTSKTLNSLVEEIKELKSVIRQLLKAAGPKPSNLLDDTDLERFLEHIEARFKKEMLDKENRQYE